MLQVEPKSPTDFEVPYLRAANIQWDLVDVTDVKKMYANQVEFDSLRLLFGDLLVSEGGDVGRSAIWRNEIDGCCIQNSVNRIRPLGSNSNRFLYYWLCAIKEAGYVDILCNKSTIAHFTAEKVEAVPVPFPTPDEQTAIAAFLDRETAKIDTLIAKQEKLIELLKEKRQAVISHAVTKGLAPTVPMKPSGVEWLGDVPEHWKAAPLKRFIKQVPGAIKTGPFGSQLTSAEMQTGPIKVYNQRSVIDADFDAGENYITEQKFSDLRGFEIAAGDILVTTRGTIGRAAIFPDMAEKGILHPCLLRIQVESTLLLREFLLTVIQDSHLLRNQIKVLSNSTTIEVIYSETMASVVLALPPIHEQQEIVDYLGKVTKKIDMLIAKAEQAIALQREHRTALISAAVTGKIDVREAISDLQEAA